MDKREEKIGVLIGKITDAIDEMGYKKSDAQDMVEVGVALSSGFATLVAHMRDKGTGGQLEMLMGAEILLKAHYGLMEALKSKSKGEGRTYLDSVGEASRNLNLDP